MNNPVAVLLGAGASFPFGVPLMSGFYSEFREHVERRHSHCFALLQTMETTGHHENPDLETLLSDLQAVVGVERGLSTIGLNADNVAASLQTARELRGYLDAFIVDRCERFDRERSARELPALLALRTLGPIWIFTTNYDRIIEFTCETHGIAWADGFESDSPRPVADWTGMFTGDVVVVKLHGSVNWYEDDPGGGLHRLDRGYSLPAYDFRLLRGSQQLRPLMIIPTLEKAALGEPYVGLATQFTDVLASAKVLIIAGNSLRDSHIRAYIRHRLDRLHVLLVSPRAGQGRDVLGRAERTHALNAGFSELLTLGGAALLRMAQSIVAADDAEVGAAVEDFIAGVSLDVADDATIRSSAVLDRLWRDLQADHASSRIAAVKALGEHPHPAITRRVAGILGSDHVASVRLAAVESLVRLAGAAATDALGSALARDESRDVQLEAALALVELGCDGSRRVWLERGVARPDARPALRAIIDKALNG